MSMSNTLYRCAGCGVEALAVRNPLTLIYQLPNGEELVTGREFSWCITCDTVKSIEPDFARYFDSEVRIAELTEKVSSPRYMAARAFDKMLGGKQQSAEQDELHDLTCGLKIARARNSSPRCLTCGSGGISGIVPISEYVHACGGRLVAIDDDDAPRFFYKPETIFLDYEGNIVEKFNRSDAYVNLAKQLSIASVVEEGRFTGVLVQALFDKVDLVSMLQDNAIFLMFARVIEARLMDGDYENPLAGFTEGPSRSQMVTLQEVPRFLLTRTQEPVSKWLRSQVVE